MRHGIALAGLVGTLSVSTGALAACKWGTTEVVPGAKIGVSGTAPRYVTMDGGRTQPGPWIFVFNKLNEVWVHNGITGTIAAAVRIPGAPVGAGAAPRFLTVHNLRIYLVNTEGEVWTHELIAPDANGRPYPARWRIGDGKRLSGPAVAKGGDAAMHVEVVFDKLYVFNSKKEVWIHDIDLAAGTIGAPHKAEAPGAVVMPDWVVVSADGSKANFVNFNNATPASSGTVWKTNPNKIEAGGIGGPPSSAKIDTRDATVRSLIGPDGSGTPLTRDVWFYGGNLIKINPQGQVTRYDYCSPP